MISAQPAEATAPNLTLTAAFEGIEGSYSHAVLDAYAARRDVTFVPQGCSSFRAVAHAVLSGKADLGLLPIDNAIAGTIREGYDVLAEYELDLLAEITWRMDHKLLGLPGATVEGLREIDSHPVVLAECGRFLGALPNNVRRVPVPDTGLAARDVAASGDLSRGAIASDGAALRYGLVELAATIADHPDNFTRFVLFRAPNARGLAADFEPAEDVANRKTSLVFAVADTPGTLGACLSVFGKHGLNVSKLDSKTRLGTRGQSSFYVDVDGDVRDDRFADALRALRDVTVMLHVIGSYDASSAPPRERRAPAIVVDARPAVVPKPEKVAFPKAQRGDVHARSRVMVGDVAVGDGSFVVIAGPCSVESRDQIVHTAEAVSRAGAVMLRGGAFKPRTSPYSFQGLGWEGVALLAEASRATGLPIVSEVMSIDQVERMAQSVDLLQIGARNMQNFDLLKAVGKTERPILLKRGMAASIDELLASAEYVLS
ncbi:MAG: N-acetylneuraminate synthase family protein, partial [Candidatus Eremiobacteraeota bacterium]|nr:N-acetylneuraminate synthase family protein [Candidatus Eremiobacteraeota bacterium]